jgi:hypothetical protein
MTLLLTRKRYSAAQYSPFGAFPQTRKEKNKFSGKKTFTPDETNTPWNPLPGKGFFTAFFHSESFESFWEAS